MRSIKNRLTILVALLMILIATVVPAAAQDAPSPTPTPDTTTIISLQITKFGGIVVALSLPARCGNDC